MGRSEEGSGDMKSPVTAEVGGGGDVFSSPLVAALDIGTTTIRCYIYDKQINIWGSAAAKVELLYPKPGWFEIDYETLWTSVQDVINGAIKNAGLKASDIACLGISTQRCSFITWNKETGVPYHNFITWKDLRADGLVNDWNDSFTLKGLRVGAKILYMLTQQKRYLVASGLKLMNPQVLSRLMWALDNVPSLRSDSESGKALFGTLDTWLLHRLTGGKLHVTDYTNASATALFDPFLLKWSDLAWKVFGVPLGILPEVRDSAGDFGECVPGLFGAAIPIRACVADQSASMFGSCCFDKGDVKITLGTGTFLNVNTGKQLHASLKGLYPVIGWKIKDDLAYVAEGASNDTGSIIEWGKDLGFYDSAKDTAELAQAVSDSGGVYFVPSFSGLQAPYYDSNAASGFIGMKLSTSKEHMIRALLESIAFRAAQLYDIMLKDSSFNFSHIRIDGGVSNNNFVSQLISNLTNQKVERAASVEMTALGAAFMAGLQAGIWKSKEELRDLQSISKEFKPKKEDQTKNQSTMAEWEKAVQRFLRWYPEKRKAKK